MALKILLLLAAVLVVVPAAMWGWALWDDRTEHAVWQALTAKKADKYRHFSSTMTEGLPEPAQRFFGFALKPGTPLFTVVELSMVGDFSLGSKEQPNTMPMSARQIVAAPFGFVWSMRAGSGAMRLSGSDGVQDNSSFSRFRLLGLFPVARAGGNRDHLRSAFGRMVAEAVFWTPAATLPGPDVRWEAVDKDTARMIMRRGDLEQAVDVTVDDAGRPTQVMFQRWSDANQDKTFRLQPFGGTLSEYKTFDGTTVPTHIVAGNHFGTDNYFPFFEVDVTSLAFLE